MSNIFDTLTEDHDGHRRLLDRLAGTEGDSTERRALFLKLKVDVEAHAAAEEQTFYAELIAMPDGQDKARHSVAEHESMSDIIEELDETDMSSPGWLTRFKTLKDKLEHHMDEEENEVFAKARDLFSDERAASLSNAFRQRKQDEVKDAA
ncbi:MAG: hemerythrin domain-containing protein [Alphaproteobacteria bacterium]|nr:hemerythrin domain-containing protein [Alphaproteobacteria bacterium]